jgi:hypothetical protein
LQCLPELLWQGTAVPVSITAGVLSSKSVCFSNAFSSSISWHRQGDYREEIDSVCETNSLDCKGKNADMVLFKCEDGPLFSLIRSPYYCGEFGFKCSDSGSGKSDYCG